MKWFVGALLLISIQVSAQGLLKPSCARRFTVAVNNDPPLFFRDSQNRPQGITHDLVVEVQKRTGCTFLEKEALRPFAVEQMKSGRIDMAMIVLRGDEFGNSAEFVPLYKVRRELALRKDLYSKDKKVREYLDDKKIVFGSIIGARTALSPDEEKKLLASRRLIEYVDYPSMFEALTKNRVQALMLTPLMNGYYLGKSPNKDQYIRETDEAATAIDVGFYLSSRRVSETEKKSIKDAFKGIQEDGSFVKILEGYMPADYLKKTQGLNYDPNGN